MGRVRVVRKKHSSGEHEYYQNLRVDTRTGIYWWDEMVNGFHYRKSTKEKTIKKALTVIKGFRAKAGEMVVSGRVRFDTLFNDALEIQRTKSHRTYTIAKQGDRRLRRFTDDPKNKCTYLDQFIKNAEAMWLRYANFAYEENYRLYKRQGDLTHDRKFLIFVLNKAYRNGLTKKKFQANDFPLRPYETDSGKALTDDEVNLLLDTAMNEMEKPWLYLMIHLGATTGMRHYEIRSLTLKEINLRKRVFELDYKKIKTRTSRKLNPFIPLDSLEVLKSFCEDSRKNGGEFIFPATERGGELNYNKHRTDIYRQWRRLKKVASVECQFKDLRSTCITNMVKERIPPTTIAAYLGNSEGEIMRVYDKVHADLREEVKLLFDGRFYDGN